MQPKLDYLLQRLKERMGEQALNEIIEHLYNLTIIEKQPPSTLLAKLKSPRGRRSKVKPYLNNKNLQDALKLLEEDFKEGRISRRTYYRAKKLLTRPF